MKIRPKVDMERREIAAVAGVTPALVSYYFPDKWDLFREAARPVVDAYAADVSAILGAEDTAGHKLRRLIRLFVAFNFEHGYVLDYYMESSAERGRQHDIDQLTDIYEDLIAFIKDLQAKGMIREGHPALIHSALWVQCKYVAQQMHLTDAAEQAEMHLTLHAKADLIHDLFLNGMATPSWDGADRAASRP